MNGIDISKHQGDIDLTSLNFDFAICRSSYGDGYVDTKFDYNYDQLIKLNKPRGAYHYAYPNTGNTPAAEAEWFLKSANKAISDGILVLDYECKSKDYVAWCLEWLNYVKAKTGITPFLYTYQNILDIFNWSEVAQAGYPLWIAKYNQNDGNIGSEPNIKWWSDYTIWQYTDQGKIPGHNGNLDLNIFNGDLTLWNRYAGKTQGFDFDFYGVKNEQELKDKIIKYLGQDDDHCAWGEPNEKGGLLGQEKIINQQLRQQLQEKPFTATQIPETSLWQAFSNLLKSIRNYPLTGSTRL